MLNVCVCVCVFVCLCVCVYVCVCARAYICRVGWGAYKAYKKKKLLKK